MTKDQLPDLKRLRTFGLILGALLALLAWRSEHRGYFIAPWLWAAAGPAALVALVRPAALGPLERSWMRVARVIASINTYVLLLIVYCLVLTPCAFIIRLTSGDPLERGEEKKTSYWKRRTSGGDAASYERQF